MKILLLMLAVLMLSACGVQPGSEETAGTAPETTAHPDTQETETEEREPPESESIETDTPEPEEVMYRELRFTAKDGYRAPMLIRITSAEERLTVYDILLETAYLDEAYDYTNSRDLLTGWLPLTEQYDEAWFETHDLYIAVTGEDSSTPRYSAEIADGNQLAVTSTHHELVSDDLIGRHILVETEKGRELSWSRTDGVCYTAADLKEIN